MMAGGSVLEPDLEDARVETGVEHQDPFLLELHPPQLLPVHSRVREGWHRVVVMMSATHKERPILGCSSRRTSGSKTRKASQSFKVLYFKNTRVKIPLIKAHLSLWGVFSTSTCSFSESTQVLFIPQLKFWNSRSSQFASVGLQTGGGKKTLDRGLVANTFSNNFVHPKKTDNIPANIF